MTSPRSGRSRGLLLLSTALAVAACGGGSAPDAQAEMAQDTFIKPIQREPLTEADLVGLDMASLALELPWTRNRVSRDAAAGAPAADVRGAEVTGHEGFDRVTFTLGDVLPVTGYEIVLAEAGATVPCGDGTGALEAPLTLVVTFGPARAGADGERWVGEGMARTGASRMARAGLACESGGKVVWVAELARGDQIRVLELREPGRVAVDVR